MNIKVIAVGKIREKYIKQGIEEFIKRIQPYSTLKTIEIPAETLKYQDQEEKCKQIEAQKILNLINDSAYVIAMEVKGKELCSQGLAKKINELNISGINQLVFIIGGAVGLHCSITKRADFQLSMSKMTLPHQLARLFLLEQIYRAFKIIKKEPYHK